MRGRGVDRAREVRGLGVGEERGAVRVRVEADAVVLVRALRLPAAASRVGGAAASLRPRERVGLAIARAVEGE